MSLKSTYQSFLSILVASIIAWNSFGYIGYFLGSTYFEALLHGEDECEMMFCHCEVSDGISICTCHHHEETDVHTMNRNHHCITDLELKNPVHDEILLKWDTRTFLVEESGLSLQLYEDQREWNISSNSSSETFIPAPLRPPNLV